MARGENQHPTARIEKLEILDDAQWDLIEGYRFYERQEVGLGAYFLDCLYSDVDSLQFYAGTHPIVFGQHRSLSKRFPFGIYYTVSDDIAYINAVLDCRRSPTWIRRRLRRSERD